MQRLDSPLSSFGVAAWSFLCWGTYGVTSYGNREYTSLIQSCPHLTHKHARLLSKPQLNRASTSKLLYLGNLPKGDRSSGHPYCKLLRSCAAIRNATKLKRTSPPSQEDLLAWTHVPCENTYTASMSHLAFICLAWACPQKPLPTCSAESAILAQE